MASDTLSVIMRAINAARTARQVDNVGDSLEDLSKKSNKATKAVEQQQKGMNIFSKAMLFVQVRLTALIFLMGFLTTAFIVFLPAITAVTAAVVALGALLAPLILLGAGTMMMFSAESKVAGTDAFALAGALEELRTAFTRMIAPAANILMRGFTDLIHMLLPALIQLQGPMEVFATFLADAFRAMGPQLVALVPLLGQLFTAAGPAIASMMKSLVPFTELLVKLAIQAMPLMAEMFNWIMNAAIWLVKAVDAVEDWKKTTAGQQAMKALTDLVAAMGRFLREAADEAAGLLKAMGPYLLAAVRALTWVLNALATLLESKLVPVLGLLAGAWAVGKIAKFAFWVGDLVGKFKKLKDILSALGGAGPAKTLDDLFPGTGRPRDERGRFKKTPTLPPVITPPPKKGFFGKVLGWGKKAIKSPFGKGGLITLTAAEAYMLIRGFTNPDTAGLTPEQERARLRAHRVPTRGAPTAIAGAGPGMGGPLMMETTLVMPDGEVLARQNLKAAKKDKARR